MVCYDESNIVVESMLQKDIVGNICQKFSSINNACSAFDFNKRSEINMIWHRATGSQNFKYLLFNKILFRSEGNPSWYNIFLLIFCHV